MGQEKFSTTSKDISKKPYKGGTPLKAEDKYNINQTLKLYPDTKYFNALNTTSQMALATNQVVGAPPLAPARIKNKPADHRLN